MVANANEEPEGLYAHSAVLMDADNGRILFEKNGDEERAMASTTKIMTCIIALEEEKLNEIVTFSKNASAQPKVHLGAKAGSEIRMRDLLYSLMLESHNDSAVAIAEHISGSVELFSERMNQKAKELGCENTHFITPNGLDAADEKGDHRTTATDLAKIMSYCVKKSSQKEKFLELTQAKKHIFADANGVEYVCYNKNAFLNMMEGAISGKTGYTSKAGYCYVAALERDGRTFVVSLLACGWPNHKNYKWSDTKCLLEYAIENYEYRDVYQEPKLTQLLVENGVSEEKGLYTPGTVELKVEAEEPELQILLRKDEDVEMEQRLEANIKAPIKKGEQLGECIYFLEGMEIGRFRIVAVNEVKEKNFVWYFREILTLYVF